MIEPGKEFYTAYARMQEDVFEISIRKTKAGYNWKYASLDTIQEIVFPILHKHGFSLVSKRQFIDGHVCLSSRLIHLESSQGIEDILAISSSIKEEYDSKDIGGNTTYNRRYALLVLLNLIQEDDEVEKQPKKDKKQSYKDSSYNQPDASPVIDSIKAEKLLDYLSGISNGDILEANIKNHNKVFQLNQLTENQYVRVREYIKKNEIK